MLSIGVIVILFIISLLIEEQLGLWPGDLWEYALVYTYIWTIKKPIKLVKLVINFIIKKIFLRSKINKIIKEIQTNKDYLSCFNNINEINDWPIKIIKNYKLNGG